MAYSTARLEKYLDYVDWFLNVDRGGIKEAPNGDQYLTFKVTTTNTRQDHLESKILTHLNNAVDPDAYGVYTGSKGGQHTSAYTLVFDESNHDMDLISGRYGGYRNDVAGISNRDAAHATQPGYTTPYFIDGLSVKIYDPHATVLGQSIGDWTADWWTWTLQAPLATNPLLDPSGTYANVNNTAPVFFIGGDPGRPEGEEGLHRSFNVPTGKPVLVPLANLASIQFDFDQDHNVAQQKAYIENELATWNKSVSGLFVEIDGVPVRHPENYFVKTGFFSPGEARPGSLLEAAVTGAVPPAGPGDDLYPTGAAGYYLMIEGLTRGEHTLHFGGSAIVPPETTAVTRLDVTDTIFVM